MNCEEQGEINTYRVALIATNNQAKLIHRSKHSPLFLEAEKWSTKPVIKSTRFNLNLTRNVDSYVHATRKSSTKKHFPDVIDRRRRNPGKLFSLHMRAPFRDVCTCVERRRDVTLTQLTGAASSLFPSAQRFLHSRQRTRPQTRQSTNTSCRSTNNLER